MTKKTRKISVRTANRLIRNAYDLAELAARLQADGHERYADWVRSISSDLGKVGRSMEDTAQRERD